MMEILWQDLRYGWRTLRRSPAFTIVAVLTLAIGIGANAAIFSVVNAVLLRPLPFPDSRRIVWIWETDENRNVHRGTASPAEFLDWRDRNHVFEELSAWRQLFFTVTGHHEAEQFWGAQVSGNFFRLFRVRPALGRDFLSEEEQPGQERVVILSYGLWQQRYGGDRNVLGASITLDGKPYTVIGVLPRGFSLFGTSRQFDLWVPFAFNRAQLNREDHELIVFARLRDDVGTPQAQAEMATILAELKKEYPKVDQNNGILVTGFHDDIVSDKRPALLILLAAVAFVLLICCANVANLTLARGTAREREIALRAALGANRNRVLRQLLTESMLLALIGGILGVFVAFGGLHLLRTLLLLDLRDEQLCHRSCKLILSSDMIVQFLIDASELLLGKSSCLCPLLYSHRVVFEAFAIPFIGINATLFFLFSNLPLILQNRRAGDLVRETCH